MCLLFYIISNTETIKGTDNAAKLASIKKLNHKTIEVAGDAVLLKGSLYGFASDSEQFSVVVETISTLNTAISVVSEAFTGAAKVKAMQSFKEGTKFEYSGSDSVKNVYEYDYNSGIKSDIKPTRSNLALSSVVNDSNFAFTGFSLKYMRGINFVKSDGSAL